MGEITDHDRLVRMETKLDGLIVQVSNHLKHHFWINITLLAFLGSLVIALPTIVEVLILK